MSGHSKWATIKHQKEAKDKERGQAFSKLSRAISVAVIEGGGETDLTLTSACVWRLSRRERQYAESNIERAISRLKAKKKENWLLYSLRVMGRRGGGDYQGNYR